MAAKAKVVAWHGIQPAEIILLSGAEDFLANRSYQALRQLLKAEDPELEVTELEADHYPPGQLFTSASPSLFAEPRLLLVQNVDKASDEFLADALKYLDLPADNVYLVLRHRGGQRGKKLLEALRSAPGALEVNCAPVTKPQEKSDFVLAEFRNAGRKISQRAVPLLVAAFSSDLAGLSAACQQLIADTSADIDEQVVNRYYAGQAEVTAFQILDAALAGNDAKALVLLRQSIESGVDPIPIAAAFASKFRTLSLIMASLGTPEAADAVNLAPWLMDKTRKELAGWSEAGLGRVIQALAEVDYGLKGGSKQPGYLLERTVKLIARQGN